MNISTIILSHNAERKENLSIIIDSLLKGTVVPDDIVVFVDNPDIMYHDSRVTVITSTKGYPVITRFALGLCSNADRILMMDDDLAVGSKTLENFVKHAKKYPEALLGLEGNILDEGDRECYTRGETVNRGYVVREVDVLIRTYFATRLHLVQALYTRELFRDQLPEKSVDDVILCMSNRYSYNGHNLVIPISKDSDVIELDSGRVGQCIDPEHYPNRNLACVILR